MTPRRLGTGDLDSCLDLAATRSWPREHAKWTLLLELGGAYGIDDPAGGLAGTVIVSRVAAGFTAIGMLVVAPRHGGRGIGRRLMVHALHVTRGTTVYLYATPAGLPLYTALGFRTVDEVVTHAGPYCGAPGPALPGEVRFGDGADLPEVSRLDRLAFGADRSRLLSRVLHAAERIALVPGQGYAVGWRNGDVLQIGPLVAWDETLACALLDAVLHDGGGSVRIDLHAAAPTSLRIWLADRGLRAHPTAPLMVHRGELPGERSALLAPLMQALG